MCKHCLLSNFWRQKCKVYGYNKAGYQKIQKMGRFGDKGAGITTAARDNAQYEVEKKT